MDGQMDGRQDGWMAGWKAGRTGVRSMDGKIEGNNCSYIDLPIHNGRF